MLLADAPWEVTVSGASERGAARPQLKTVAWEWDGEQLQVVYDIRDYFLLPDPDGRVEALLALLAEGGRTVPELAGRCPAAGARSRSRRSTRWWRCWTARGCWRTVPGPGGWSRPSGSGTCRTWRSSSRARRWAAGRKDFQQALRQAHVLVLSYPDTATGPPGSYRRHRNTGGSLTWI